MNKKISYTILGILIIFVFVVIFFSLYQKPSGTPSSGGETSVSQTQEEVNALMRQAIDTQDASFCDRMKKEGDKKDCQRNVIIAEATVKRDASICERVEDTPSRTACQDNVMINLAIDAKNPNLCQNLIDKNRISDCEKYITP